MITIPTKDLSSYLISIQLDGSTYGFSFNWNIRDESWTMIVKDSLGNNLLSQKLVLSYPLFQQYIGIGLPPGELMAVDTTNSLTSIGRNDLGQNSDVKLIYTTEAELVTLQAQNLN